MKILLIEDSLPNLTHITNPAKIADMIRISSHGLCGGNDFGYPCLNDGKLPAKKAGPPSGQK
jgi:hypothetical protein